MEDKQINEVSVEGNVCVVVLVTEKIVEHIGSVTGCPHFVYAMDEQEEEKDNLAGRKNKQQGSNMLLGPYFLGRREKNKRGEEKPNVAFEGTPSYGHVFGVDESQKGYEADAKQKKTVRNAIVLFEVLPLFTPVPLGNAQQHQQDADGPHEERGERQERHHQHHQHKADIEVGV